MPDLTAKKQAFLTSLPDFAERALAFRNACSEFSDYFTDCEFATGAANQITQADIDASTARHLSPAAVAAVMTAIGALASLNAANRDALRTAALNPVARSTLPGR